MDRYSIYVHMYIRPYIATWIVSEMEQYLPSESCQLQIYKLCVKSLFERRGLNNRYHMKPISYADVGLRLEVSCLV